MCCRDQLNIRTGMLFWWLFPSSWRRHQMETFSVLLPISAGNSTFIDEFPAQRPVTRSFDILFDLRLNERLSKQSWGWWFETLSHPLWPIMMPSQWHKQYSVTLNWAQKHFANSVYTSAISFKFTRHCAMKKEYLVYSEPSLHFIISSSASHYHLFRYKW